MDRVPEKKRNNNILTICDDFSKSSKSPEIYREENKEISQLI